MGGVAERFWSKVEKSDSCWEWTAAINTKGYGEFWLMGKLQRAHRVSWLLSYGEFPSNFVCHHCDNPKCVRPEHLFEGTHSDNIKDMHKKERNTANATLTPNQVRNIRRNLTGEKGELIKLAHKYCVSPETIGRIRARKRWAWLL